ncbi:beta strand repeat-containing protein, partial [Selenomonas sp.]|uniref:beta strand repeat-containing protein n=1 Tax=Selenomonas sp. TaxID=2053611 RepID=UPI003FA2C17D
MFKKRTAKRHLALFVALALSSGTLLTAAPADAADVSGNDLKIDAEHPTVPPAHRVDTDSAAGGAITNASDTGNVTGNTLTLTERFFAGSLYGGYTRGSGNVENNKVFVHNKAANVVQGHVFGGLAKGVGGNAKHNTVTLTGGTFSQNIYGGSSFNGDATHNTVNLGDGKKTFDGEIHDTIYGGDGADSTRDHRTGNTLNVNTNVVADNIKNFSTINFNYNPTVSAGSMLHLNDSTSEGTRVDWNGINLTGTPEQSLTLMAHANGMKIDNYAPGSIKQLTLTDTHEAFIRAEDWNGTDKYQTIRYTRSQFKGVTKSVVTNGENVYGGFSFIGNTTTGNHVTVTSTTTPGSVDVYGGYTEGDGTTADATKRYDSVSNTVTMAGGAVRDIYGGYTSTAVGKAEGNTVTVKAGTVTGNIYGGKSEQGDATNNTVTIAGGTVKDIYGGKSAQGNATNNTVNLGDGTSADTGTIDGTIFGGSSTNTTKDQKTGNTLNVNANATAHNIKNFSKIQFNFSTLTNTSTSLLELTTGKTKLDSLNQLYVKNAKVGSGTLMWNANGFEISDATDVGRTEEKTETLIKKASTDKAITYRTYQFKDSTTTDFEGANVWGGRSTLGNTTTNNKVTVSGNHSGKDAYGGWTSGTGSTATGENAKNHSIDNEITLEGAASEVNHMTGGSTDIAVGKATGNHAILTDGKVGGNLAGGSARDGEVSGNEVKINGGRVEGTTHGGITGGMGKAEKNTVTLTNGTAAGDIFGGISVHGDTVENIVTIKGGSATTANVYGGKAENNGNATANKVFIEGGGKQDIVGGYSQSGNAMGNIVTITGGSVRNVDGGRSLNGHATNNIVNIGSADAGFSGSITGKINGGSGNVVGNDYVTGNTLNLYGNVSAPNINHFAEINFHFNSHVNQSTSFLSLNDSGGTIIKNLSG